MVVLQVPNSFLFLAGVCPDRHTEVLSLLSVAILLHVWDLRNIPNSDGAFDTRREEQVLVFWLASRVVNTCYAKQRPSVPTQGQIRLHVRSFVWGSLSKPPVHVREVPELNHAVLWNGRHCVNTGNELDAPDDVHVGLELIFLLEFNMSRLFQF